MTIVKTTLSLTNQDRQWIDGIGEEAADEYYNAFFDHFEVLAVWFSVVHPWYFRTDHPSSASEKSSPCH